MYESRLSFNFCFLGASTSMMTPEDRFRIALDAALATLASGPIKMRARSLVCVSFDEDWGDFESEIISFEEDFGDREAAGASCGGEGNWGVGGGDDNSTVLLGSVLGGLGSSGENFWASRGEVIAR
jgi:hypothetical protein